MLLCFVWLHRCMHVRTYMHTCKFMHVCMHVRVYVGMHGMPVYARAYVCIRQVCMCVWLLAYGNNPACPIARGPRYQILRIQGNAVRPYLSKAKAKAGCQFPFHLHPGPDPPLAVIAGPGLFPAGIREL